MGDVCRLCLKSQNLRNVYDMDTKDNIEEIILVSCGVEIKRTDLVSQKICETCFQIAVKIYKFRTMSVKNNESLLKEKSSDSANTSSTTISTSTTTADKTSTSTTFKESESKTIDVPIKPKSKVEEVKHMHPSLQEILKKYPKIKFPRNIQLEHHYGPCITVFTNEVSNYQASYKRKLSEIPIATDSKKIKISEVNKQIVEEPKTEQTNTIDLEQKTSQRKKKPVVTLQELLRNVNKNKKSPKKASISPNKKITVLESVLLGQCSSPKIYDYLQTTNSSKDCQIDQTKTDINTETKSIKNSLSLKKTEVKKSSSELEKILLDNSNLQKSSDISNNSSVSVPPAKEIENLKESLAIEDSNSSSTNFSLQINESPEEDNISCEKSEFIKSLLLVPKNSVNSVQPTSCNESLFSRIRRSQTLYTCKICNSNFNSRWHLRTHQEKKHTRCQFCKKKFATVELKNKHNLEECGKLCVKQREIRIVLERVDTNDSIVAKYPSAFIKSNNDDVSNVSTEYVDVEKIDDLEETKKEEEEEEKKKEEEDKEEENKNIETIQPIKLTLKQTSDGNYSVVPVECIYISDDDDDDDVIAITEPEVKKINLQNDKLLKESSDEDSISMLKVLLTKISEKDVALPKNFVEKPTQSKLLKNHKPILKKRNIPVEIRYGKELTYSHKLYTLPPKYDSKNLWYNVHSIPLVKKKILKQLNEQIQKDFGVVHHIPPVAKVLPNSTILANALTKPLITKPPNNGVKPTVRKSTDKSTIVTTGTSNTNSSTALKYTINLQQQQQLSHYSANSTPVASLTNNYVNPTVRISTENTKNIVVSNTISNSTATVNPSANYQTPLQYTVNLQQQQQQPAQYPTNGTVSVAPLQQINLNSPQYQQGLNSNNMYGSLIFTSGATQSGPLFCPNLFFVPTPVPTTSQCVPTTTVTSQQTQETESTVVLQSTANKPTMSIRVKSILELS